MKKLYTILGLAFLAGSANAQIYFGKDFEDNSVTTGGCTQEVVVGTNDWFASSFGGNRFAKATNGGSADAEVWYITPALDLSTATNPIVSFSNAVSSHNGPDIEVYTSANYSGSGDPNSNGVWTQLSPNLSTGSYTFVNSGELAITNTSTETYVAFKYTGTTTSGKIWEIDSIFVAEAGTPFGLTVIPPPPSTVSIYDIQNSTGASPYENQDVHVAGIVTHLRDGDGYYITSGEQGAFTGVQVFDATNVPSVGDSIEFDATVDEYFDCTQLTSVTNYSLKASGKFFLSTPISTNDIATEEYEGVLVKVCGTCVDEEGQYQDWTINDGSGLGAVDNYNADFHPSGTNINPPVSGNSYNVIGIIDYAYSEFKLLPTSGAAVTQTAQCIVSIDESNVEYNVFPNPTQTILNVDVDGTHQAVMTDIKGSVVLNTMLSGFSTLDVSSLHSGVYFLNIEGNVTKVMVK